ncbi:MAG: ATP-binding cassette domain-containing protein [Alphaproteobacteria bacterium]|nr:ATP-binding cassette domain-containing protein [Alphaproteobacteria bacterium]
MEGVPALALAGVDKSFGAVHANRAIDLSVAQGSIHGIVGENGAGKSTLMGIAYGYYRPDAGTIRVDGRVVEISEPQDAIRAGIGMVHQHFMLVETFTVLENILLGAEGGALLARGEAEARAGLARLMAEYALEVDLDARVADLDVGAQQRVEILKALWRGARILILDEPTAVLTPQETDRLFALLAKWRDQGRTVLLITHKLREILAITDRVTVMRRGAVVATLETARTSQAELAELMVGRRVLLKVDKRAAVPGAEILRAEGLRHVDARGIERLRGISFAVHAGEIVGIAGVAGNGQSELIEALAGLKPLAGGRILFKGAPVDPPGSADACRSARARRIAHVPEDRLRMGLVASFAARESAILGYHDDADLGSGPFLDPDATRTRTNRLMEAFDVRPRLPELRSANFSGGNQQKLVLGREIDRDPELLIVGQPTRGVDIGAIEFIHRRLVDLRDAGKAILLVSCELDEILSLADRILVMFDGRIAGELPRAAADERQLGLLMAGVAAAA